MGPTLGRCGGRIAWLVRGVEGWAWLACAGVGMSQTEICAERAGVCDTGVVVDLSRGVGRGWRADCRGPGGGRGAEAEEGRERGYRRGVGGPGRETRLLGSGTYGVRGCASLAGRGRRGPTRRRSVVPPGCTTSRSVPRAQMGR